MFNLLFSFSPIGRDRDMGYRFPLLSTVDLDDAVLIDVLEDMWCIH